MVIKICQVLADSFCKNEMQPEIVMIPTCHSNSPYSLSIHEYFPKHEFLSSLNFLLNLLVDEEYVSKC